MSIDAVAIIGANMAGCRVADTLRMAGYSGKIHLIGEEKTLPYERPPLSKEILWTPESLPEGFFLNSEASYKERDIDLILETRVETVDLAQKNLKLSSGATVDFSHLVFCTGARVRKLDVPGKDLRGVHYLRTLEDAQALSPSLIKGARIGIVGMGVIGAEVAASARKNGCEVVCIEPQKIPMARALGDRFGAWLAQIHREEGVDVRLGVGVEKLNGENGQLISAQLTDGSTVKLDAVVVGIGVIPNVELAQDAGLEIDNGIVVDAFAAASLPQVYAAGDVANMPLFEGGQGRVETYQNAQDQAAIVAQNIVDQKSAYHKPLWFWSDQYDVNLQVCGDVNSQADIVVRGCEKNRDFSAFFLQKNIVVGVLTVNRPRDMGVGKRLVAKNKEVTPQLLSDESVNLRGFLK